jgi:hypothetical protein
MKKQKILLPTYLYSPSRNPGPGRCPLKKWIKRDVSNFLKTKKNKKYHLLLTLNQSPGPERYSLKKKRKRNVMPFQKQKKTKNLLLPIPTYFYSPRRNQRNQGTLMTFPITKKNPSISSFIAKPKSRSRKVFPNEEKKKER